MNHWSIKLKNYSSNCRCPWTKKGYKATSTAFPSSFKLTLSLIIVRSLSELLFRKQRRRVHSRRFTSPDSYQFYHTNSCNLLWLHDISRIIDWSTHLFLCSQLCHKKTKQTKTKQDKAKRITEARFKIRFLASFVQLDKFDLRRLNLCISFPAKLYFV